MSDSRVEHQRTDKGGTDQLGLSPKATEDLKYMSRHDVEKVVFTGVDSKSITDGAGMPVSKIDFSFGKLVLSLSYPEFDEKPDDSANHLDITEQFRGFRLIGPPELVDDGRRIRIRLIGPENKSTQITAQGWSYFIGLHI